MVCGVWGVFLELAVGVFLELVMVCGVWGVFLELAVVCGVSSLS